MLQVMFFCSSHLQDLTSEQLSGDRSGAIPAAYSLSQAKHNIPALKMKSISQMYYSFLRDKYWN